jgi:hypothetical protein
MWMSENGSPEPGVDAGGVEIAVGVGALASLTGVGVQAARVESMTRRVAATAENVGATTVCARLVASWALDCISPGVEDGMGLGTDVGGVVCVCWGVQAATSASAIPKVVIISRNFVMS